ncbi:MAG TPA: energy-coupling factor ABC transporter substrate-binding protein [Candidatus Competibacteraceae bacterium]|nr:energy-coupling factor ABC transporter substrate-binding protein [Candidatus Competibacteraceae bacterium]MCP5134063.1 energy-coupling factor ABC transporter substrate-binding protein [Gammaproteobacteria bacterium]HPF58998.1 energy-coupling factor ABC transporter substrate-binding protein [Candidatus Competibacteraceae bacterium]HRY18998.1 energy-coupling factor ABC transporter substrate-binding protein [Candidatus Competibacteraceae bacterium]
MKARNSWWLLAVAAALIVASVLIGSRHEGTEFAGTDGQAMKTIATLNPDYQPWFDFIWAPPPEIASGLFALQAALGAGVLGYYLGFKRGQRQGRQSRSDAGD